MNRPEMPYRNMGRCGLKLSALSLGSWLTYGGSVTDASVVRELVKEAFEAGVNFFDIADIYAKGGAETMLGKILRDYPRNELVVSTKVFWPMSKDANGRGLSRKHIMEAIDASLKRLGMDYVDIYFCHRHDPDTPVEETARAMDDLIRMGKVLYWGTSEWTGDQIFEAQRACVVRNLHPPQVEQPQYSLLCREKVETDVQPAAEQHGMGLVTWSPLAYGLLTGKYDKGVPLGSRLEKETWLKDRYMTEDNMDRIRKMQAIADQLGCTRAQLALAWLLKQPGVSSVITGATKPEQLRDNLGALSVELTGEVIGRLGDLFPAETKPAAAG